MASLLWQHAAWANHSEVTSIWNRSSDSFEAEDFSIAFIRLEDDMIALCKEAWVMHAESLGNPILLGTKGGFTLSSLTLYTDMNGYMVKISSQGLPRVDAFAQKMADFVQVIQGKKLNPIDPKSIVIMDYIVSAIYSLAESEKEVAINLPSNLT